MPLCVWIFAASVTSRKAKKLLAVKHASKSLKTKWRRHSSKLNLIFYITKVSHEKVKLLISASYITSLTKPAPGLVTMASVSDKAKKIHGNSSKKILRSLRKLRQEYARQPLEPTLNLSKAPRTKKVKKPRKVWPDDNASSLANPVHRWRQRT